MILRVVWRLSCGFSMSCGQQCVFSSLRAAVIITRVLAHKKTTTCVLDCFFLFVSRSVLTTAREVQQWMTVVSRQWTRVVVGLRKKKNPKDFSEVTHNVHALLFRFFHYLVFTIGHQSMFNAPFPAPKPKENH